MITGVLVDRGLEGAAGRMAGWYVHVLEQEPENRLIRPEAIFIGPDVRAFEPINRRTGMPQRVRIAAPAADGARN